MLLLFTFCFLFSLLDCIIFLCCSQYIWTNIPSVSWPAISRTHKHPFTPVHSTQNGKYTHIHIHCDLICFEYEEMVSHRQDFNVWLWLLPFLDHLLFHGGLCEMLQDIRRELRFATADLLSHITRGQDWSDKSITQPTLTTQICKPATLHFLDETFVM